MKKIFLTLAILAGIISSAQVKIGDNVTTLDANSLLELESTNKGVLFPRVALINTTSSDPLTAHVAGMVVYNTATTGDVTTGMYANDGAKWVKMGATVSKTLYTDNDAITSARTVTLNNNDLTFTAGVGGTGKTVVASTFKTAGAVYGNVRILNAINTPSTGYDLTSSTVFLSSDYILILSKSTAQSISMPNPAGDNTGRLIYLINNSTAAGGAGGCNFIGSYIPIPNTAIPTVRAQAYISDGSAWYKLIY